MDDGSGAIGRIRGLVKDVRFVACPVGQVFDIGATHVDTGIGVIANPELGADSKIGVRVFRNKKLTFDSWRPPVAPDYQRYIARVNRYAARET